MPILSVRLLSDRGFSVHSYWFFPSVSVDFFQSIAFSCSLSRTVSEKYETQHEHENVLQLANTYRTKSNGYYICSYEYNLSINQATLMYGLPQTRLYTELCVLDTRLLAAPFTSLLQDYRTHCLRRTCNNSQYEYSHMSLRIWIRND